MRFMIWNTEMQTFECNECRWHQALCTDCSDPAERVEMEFNLHRCEEHQQRSAA
jgi:hypothetical protein